MWPNFFQKVSELIHSDWFISCYYDLNNRFFSAYIQFEASHCCLMKNIKPLLIQCLDHSVLPFFLPSCNIYSKEVSFLLSDLFATGRPTTENVTRWEEAGKGKFPRHPLQNLMILFSRLLLQGSEMKMAPAKLFYMYKHICIMYIYIIYTNLFHHTSDFLHTHLFGIPTTAGRSIRSYKGAWTVSWFWLG